MILRRQLAKNKKKGFTLIELIVVIVIIAIIAAIAVPALTRYIESANKRAAQAMAHNIQVVVQAEVTDFFDATVNAAIATEEGDLFKDPPPAGFPADYDPSVVSALNESGVFIATGSLTNITFVGNRLQSFEYTHNNDDALKIWYQNGVFSFEDPN